MPPPSHPVDKRHDGPDRRHDGSLGADFRPQNIRVAVHLWHGEADANAPVAMGRYMATAIPNSHIAFYPGEGTCRSPRNTWRRF
jgi:pimeloyl-ACP methyl ester carboxylesterase